MVGGGGRMGLFVKEPFVSILHLPSLLLLAGVGGGGGVGGAHH